MYYLSCIVVINESLFLLALRMRKSSAAKGSKGSKAVSKRGPTKPLKEGHRIVIDRVSDSGEPMEPLDCRRKYINQCGVVVRDMVPISLEEWHQPKDEKKPTTYVDERLKGLCWDALLTKVNLPHGLPEQLKMKVKQWTLSKMAEQFRTWKKNLWKAYLKAEEQDPEFTGPLVKIQQ